MDQSLGKTDLPSLVLAQNILGFAPKGQSVDCNGARGFCFPQVWQAGAGG